MPIRCLACAFAILFAGALARPAEAQFAVRKPSVEDYHLEFSIATWKPSPGLVLRTGAGGTDIDIVDTFGLETTSFTDFRVVLKPGRKHKIRVGYVPFTYSRDTVLTRTFTFAGTTYTVNVPASASVDWKLWQLAYEWDFISNDHVFVGVIAEVQFNQVKTTLSSPLLNLSSELNAQAPIPAIGGIVRGYVVPRKVSVTLQVAGIKVPEQATFEGRLVDYEVYGQANLGSHLGVQGGYRSIDARYLIAPDAGSLKMKGPYIGGSVRF